MVAGLSVALFVLLVPLGFAPGDPEAVAGEKRKPVDPSVSSAPYEWASAGGVVCSCRGPATYDERGACS